MDCQETLALIPEYQEGALPEAKQRQAQAHLSNCTVCHAALAEAKNLDVFLRGAIQVSEPPADFWGKQEARVLQAAGRTTTAGRTGRLGFYLWIVGVAAVLAVAVGIFAITRSTPVPPPPSDVAKEPPVPAAPEKESAPMRDPFARKHQTETPSPIPQSPTHPSQLVFPTEPRSQDPAPEPPRPFVPPSTTAILPGDPEHLERLTNENLEVGLAETASDRVMGLFKAADGRLSELKAALGAEKGSVAEDLASAYTMILRQGIAAVLDDRGEDAQDLDTARTMAKIRAGGNARTLAALEPKAQGTLKDALHDALLATREIANR